MPTSLPSFRTLALKTVVIHTITYFVAGLFAYVLLDYAKAFADPSWHGYMRQTTDPMVMLGPLLQPIRGLLFACAFYPVRSVVFGARRGWLVLWLLLVVLGILSTFGPAPGSVEGLIYTTVPPWAQIRGLSEVITQSALLAWLLCYWVEHPEKTWLSRLLWTLFVIAMVLPAMGAMANAKR